VDGSSLGGSSLGMGMLQVEGSGLHTGMS